MAHVVYYTAQLYHSDERPTEGKISLENTTFAAKLKNEGQSFLEAVSRSNETIYLVMLSVYVSIFLLIHAAWAASVGTIVSNIRYGLLSVVMWGAALYLLFVIADWKKLWKNTPALIVIGAALLSATFWFSRKMSTNSYGVVMDVFFCLMACGKDYKKMLKCMLAVTLIMLLIAGIGVPAKYSYDMMKPENVSPGHSLGIDYPNTWGCIAFLAMMMIWYLWLRNRPLPTFVFFWGMTAFMYFYISCRTIAVLAAVFPVLATLVDWLERRAKRRDESRITVDLADGTAEKKPRAQIGPFSWAVVAEPFIAFAFMLYASMQYKWVHKHLYHTKLYTFAMRFVQGGLYFKTYGMPIFGNPYRSNQYTYVNVNGEFEKVGILDSSFAAYIIMRGMFWLAYTLLWLCFAIWKALKKRDYAIPFLCGIILVFAMMERPGLEMWYNFILLYPLAKVANDPLKKVVAAAASVEAVADAAGVEEAPVETVTDAAGAEEAPVESEAAETEGA